MIYITEATFCFYGFFTPYMIQTLLFRSTHLPIYMNYWLFWEYWTSCSFHCSKTIKWSPYWFFRPLPAISLITLFQAALSCMGFDFVRSEFQLFLNGKHCTASLESDYSLYCRWVAVTNDALWHQRWGHARLCVGNPDYDLLFVMPI